MSNVDLPDDQRSDAAEAAANIAFDEASDLHILLSSVKFATVTRVRKPLFGEDVWVTKEDFNRYHADTLG